jgi:hypothetical protein
MKTPARKAKRASKDIMAKVNAERAALKAAIAAGTPVKLKKPPTVNPKPAVRVSFDALRDLIGKGQGDPAVQAVLATAGKIRNTGLHIIAEEAGFEFSLGRSPDEQVATRPLVALHLHAGHSKRTRAFVDLPKPFAFTDRASLIAVAPAPHSGLPTTRSRMKGLAPLAMPMAQETWKMGKLDFTAHYRDNYVRSYSLMD